MIKDGLAQRFVERLHALEQDRDVEGIVGLFADDCDVGNVVADRVFHGREGARDFWSAYRGTFGEVESAFRAVIDTGDQSALEWTTTATAAATGAPIHYDGVSIIDVRDDRIVRFRAYFDPVDLGRQVGDHSGGAGE